MTYRLSHIIFHKARERRLYCNTPTTDNAVKFNMWKSISMSWGETTILAHSSGIWQAMEERK